VDVAKAVEQIGFILTVIAIFLWLAFTGTYAEVGDGKLEIVKFYLLRNSIDIRSVRAVRYRAFGMESLDGIDIQYEAHHGTRRSAILGSIAAYGRRQISDIVSAVVKSNPGIQLDERVSTLVSKPYIYVER
jgi:hypothetical protein